MTVDFTQQTNGNTTGKNLENGPSYKPALQTQNIIAIAGGKGGVGKTLITAGMGVALAEMDKKTADKMKKILPPHVVIKNPIDLTGDADVERYRIAMEGALKDTGVDMLIVIALMQLPTLTAEIVDVVASLADKSEKPIVFIAAGGRFTEVLKKNLEDTGVPTFSYPEKAAKALKALHNYSLLKGGAVK